MLYIFISLIILLLFLYINKNIHYHEHYNKIPYILFKTGPYDIPTDELKKKFDYNKKKLKVNKVFYYNDEECYDFIQSMGINIINAYNSLIPTAYKADLWRYCILYKYGGIYGDMSQKFYKTYDVNKNNVDMVLVRDINENAIQVSFIASKPNNNFLKYLIINITTDILNKKKGINCLDITGPYAFGRNFKKFFNLKTIPEGIVNLKGLDNNIYKIKIDLRQYKGFIFKNIKDKKIVASTKNLKHDKDLIIVNKVPHYGELYRKNKIFRN